MAADHATAAQTAMSISVIVPSFNRATLIAQTLDSLLAQTRPPTEIVLVDDGSTDHTREVIASYRSLVIYHYQKNAGLAAARAAGLAQTTGDYVLMLDSDDLLCPTALGRLEAALDASPDAALAYCRSRIIDDNGIVIEPLWDQVPHEGMVWEHLIQHNFIRSPGAALIRRSHLDRLESETVPMEVADWSMWLRLAETAPFALVREPLFLYRVHGSSMSQNLPAMYTATDRLYCVMLERQRQNAQRRRMVQSAYRYFLETARQTLLRMADEDRLRGDVAGAHFKLDVLFRLGSRRERDFRFWIYFAAAQAILQVAALYSGYRCYRRLYWKANIQWPKVARVLPRPLS